MNSNQNTGWQCPCCGRVMAPWVRECTGEHGMLPAPSIAPSTQPLLPTAPSTGTPPFTIAPYTPDPVPWWMREGAIWYVDFGSLPRCTVTS